MVEFFSFFLFCRGGSIKVEVEKKRKMRIEEAEKPKKMWKKAHPTSFFLPRETTLISHVSSVDLRSRSERPRFWARGTDSNAGKTKECVFLRL